jgi:transcriptional regulator with XRE-family HTH domain
VAGVLQQRLGRNLRRLRTERGWSQEAFADELAVHRTYVGGLERGERNASLQVVEWLAESLGVDPLDLLREVDDQQEAGTVLRAAHSGAARPPDARSVAQRPARRRTR